MRRGAIGLWALAILAAQPVAARSLPKADDAPAARACPEMGDGFVQLPGSTTCVHIDGSVRVETMRQSAGTSYVPANH